ncbi:MAG: Dyp-type peroxidase [Anaerolineae bacterium]
MTTETSITLALNDIQAGALRPRPKPYTGAYFLFRIDDRQAGREFLRRLIPALASAADPDQQAWLAASLTFQGLKALGVPQDSLASFSPEFQQGMAARAAEFGDFGENAPDQWEQPLGSPDVHLVLAAVAPHAAQFEAIVAHARDTFSDLPGVSLIWRQDVASLPTERDPFGFKDGIGQPAIEGSGAPGSNPHEAPLKAGEFILGYQDETGDLSPVPQPDVLGRNGTYMVFRKLHTRVAAFRQYLKQRATSPADEELLAAKIVGRWPSGAPLALAPQHDDPELGADPHRNNAFLYAADDARGLKCPLGSHIRRMHPRDAVVVGEVRLHRMLRRGTSYGPPLPDGVLEDDGADRGIMFAFIGAHIARQFEFVQAQWVNDGKFFGAPAEKDPLIGPNDGSGQFTIPQQPIRRKLQGLPAFVVNRGGEYCFMPSLPALRWLADLDTQ